LSKGRPLWSEIIVWTAILNARPARWLEFLSEYDLDIKHIKGKENKAADALSRRVHEMHPTAISMYRMDLKVQNCRGCYSRSTFVYVEEELQQGNSQQKIKGYKLQEDGILLYSRRVYVPNSVELRNVVLRKMHIMECMLNENMFRHIVNDII